MSQKDSIDNVINTMVQDAQKPEAPAAKGSIITGKRNQLDSVQIGDKNDTEEWRTMNAYLREGDDRIGILPEGWKEAHSTPATEQSPESSTSTTSSRKRTWEGTELSKDDNVSKRRKLKSDYCPATHTTWKPAWLETTQCYPVNQMGEDMSEIEVLRGDAVHRNAEKLKRLLEMECMYIPSHQVDELVSIAEETVKSLKRTREYYATEPSKKIRIERHEFR
jgi:4-hydroxy-3-methylbut-2-enyl diphosphate reductase IspH